MVNYATSKIYKLVNNVDDKIYVGSTCNELRKRKRDHKSKSVCCPDRQVYKHLNAVGWVNVEIILIESYVCTNKDELHKRERHWIDELKPELNKYIPTRTDKQYRDDNKEYNNQRSKIYRSENKEHIKQTNKIYRENNNEHIKQYKEDHKEHIKQYDNQRYHNNKKMRTCICGSTYNQYKLSSRTRHYNSNKHIDFVEELLTRFHL